MRAGRAWPWVFLAAFAASAGPFAGAEPRPVGRADLKAVGVDLASLAPLTLSAMRREVDLVLRPAGLALAWRESGPLGESGADELRVVFLRSTGLGAHRGTGTLGSTARRGPAPVTWVYVPNVALALGLEPDAVSGSFEAQRLVGVALGRVVAHEVVHAVAPEVEHASAGVMRPKLHAFQLVTGRPALEADCAEALAAGARARLAGRGPAR